MGAREYDPRIGRWLSADTIVPEPANPQSFNRYSYVYNNSLKHVDPTGHFTEEEIMGFFDVDTWEKVLAFFETGGSLEGRWGWLEVLRQAQTTDNLYGSSKKCFPGHRGLEGMPQGEEWENIGHFWIANGRLMVGLLSGKSMEHQEIATTFNYYKLEHYPLGFGPKEKFSTTCYKRYSHMKINWSEVDWLDAGIDTAGIVADVFSVGTAGRYINIIDAGLGTMAFSADLGAQHATTMGEQIITEEHYRDLVLDYAGFAPILGTFSDVYSLYLNFSSAVYWTP